MCKEPSWWLSAEAARALSKTGVGPPRLLRCRCVPTWKKEMNTATGRTKARLATLGSADPDILRLRAESPAVSRRGRPVFLGVAASSGWKVDKADAVTALLQGDTTEKSRSIYVGPPPEV